jgi:hypothetical protein
VSQLASVGITLWGAICFTLGVVTMKDYRGYGVRLTRRTPPGMRMGAGDAYPQFMGAIFTVVGLFFVCAGLALL